MNMIPPVQSHCRRLWDKVKNWATFGASGTECRTKLRSL